MFDFSVALGMSVMAAGLVVFFAWAVGKASPLAERRARLRRRTWALVGGVAWMAVLALLALSGVLARFDHTPPPFLLVGVVSVFGAAALGLSPLGKQLSRLPLAVLVGWQAFRLPLELIMHRAAEIGLMPSVMSFSGRNFDIVSGAFALVLAVALTRFHVPLWAIVAWQLVASALLLNVVAVAIAATPMFAVFGDSQLNTWVAHFPYVWLPGVMVASAVLGHVVIARRLLSARKPLELSEQKAAEASP